MTDYTPDKYFPAGYFPPNYFGGDAGGPIVGALVGTATGTSAATGNLTNGNATETPARGGWHVPYRRGERRARGLEWDRPEHDLEAELREVYAELHGELRDVAPVVAVREAVAEHAAPSDAPMPPVAAIDFAALAADLDAARALLAAYARALDEQEEEEAVTLLLLSA
ncbi:MAG: hypothetical protein ACK5XN_40280 [Bacteroidota bacterium]|jgi:hypothetical protein